MEKRKMVLKDGTELTLEAGSSLGSIRVVYANKEELAADWEKLTKDNLSSVQLEQEGTLTGAYENLILGNPALQVDIQAGGTLLASWGIREKTEMEKLADRVAAVEETTDVLTMDALMGGETV